MEQLIENVDSVILGFVEGSFGSLSDTVTVLWRMMFVVFIAVYGYRAIILGKLSAPDLVYHAFRIIILMKVSDYRRIIFVFAPVPDKYTPCQGAQLVTSGFEG